MLILNKIENKFKSKKEERQDLYTRILLWAYDKQETGFTMEEIRPTFDLSQEEDTWVCKIFLTTSDQDRKLFEHFRNDESGTTNKHPYALNEKGITAAINYKALRHSEKSSEQALWLATFSIFLTAAGIFLQWHQTNLAEIQAIPEQITQARAKQDAIKFCQQNPKDPDSGLYFLDGSARMATCEEVLKTYQ
ncbi:MAG: hypothetical protein ACYC75_01385 [Minisyncoccota bacterium]